MAPYSSKTRRNSPNDFPALLIAFVLIVINMFWAYGSLHLSAILQGISAVLLVVALRQLPWWRWRMRWQLQAVATTFLSVGLLLTTLWGAGQWRWWNCLILIFFFLTSLLGIVQYRWTSLLMIVSCGIAGWLLL